MKRHIWYGLFKLAKVALFIVLACVLDAYAAKGNDPASLRQAFVALHQCFSEDDTVQVEDGRVVRMKDLTVGEKVLTGSGRFEAVFTWGHREEQRPTEFLELVTTDPDNTSLEITQDHMVFLYNRFNPVRAGALRPGDVLQGAHNRPIQILEIHSYNKTGAYAPFTTGGSLVVNGVVVSSYNSLATILGGDAWGFFPYHAFAQMGMAPLRVICDKVADSPCQIDEEQGMPHYVRHGVAAIEWTSRRGILVQSLFWVIISSLTAAFWLLEKVLRGNYLAALGLAVMFWLDKRRQSKFDVRKQSQRQYDLSWDLLCWVETSLH